MEADPGYGVDDGTDVTDAAADVAELLKINVETLDDLVHAGKLPVTKLGARWRFRSSEIHDWFRVGAREQRP